MKKNTLLLLTAVLLASPVARAQEITQAHKDRAAALVRQLTLDEKIDLISGKIDGFCTQAVERLGIPAIRMADGPQGVRNYGNKRIQSTFYPCGLSVAASWNRQAVREMGRGIGCAAKANGIQIMLGPGVNIYRSALCGRNFEYYGEDPYLASETASEYVQGMQEQGVMATIKHFALNNQEYDRHGTSSNADERTINEIYFATFRKAVEKARVGAVMTSYNPINGMHAAENPWLIRDNLRAWGFEGIAMSDWNSCYDPLNFVKGGLDLEMPWAKVAKPDLIKGLLANGVITEDDLDEKCQHILQAFAAFGFLDKSTAPDPAAEDKALSARRAYEIALEGPVLLKNEGGILPLKPGKKNKYVVIGPNAYSIVCGGGSGWVNPEDGHGVTPAAGMQALGKDYPVILLGHPDPEVLRSATAVIMVTGFDEAFESESRDRSYNLPPTRANQVDAVLKHTDKLVLVINSGGEFDLSRWLDKVPAIIMDWYPGQEGGNALAALLTGKVSPSGKLPFTFWGSLDKNPVSGHYTPQQLQKAIYRASYPYTDYSEGVFLGYRGVKHFGVEPLFPFGFGLSYTSFRYDDLSVVPAGDGVDVSFTVTNTGAADAKEVAQVYVCPQKPSVLRPDRELKGYDKKLIRKGASERFSIHLGPDAFSYYDVKTHAWKQDPGAYRIAVGASSADIRLQADIRR
ncbi:MAG: glycoside hydrolase family 3 C-terminal domain-containing protein [Bacteroidales bacterium]|nr:glycoside hydrolase family 3 C-terminal domain-containing protein [Bacteroidales bacterium]